MYQRIIEPGARTPAELQDRLEATRHIYDTHKRRLTGEDKEWEKRKTFLINEMTLLVNGYNGDGGSKAAFILGRIRSILIELNQPSMVVAEWESIQRQWQKQNQITADLKGAES